MRYMDNPHARKRPITLERARSAPITPSKRCFRCAKPADSLTRQRIGESPKLSHLLSVGTGRVVSLTADDKFVYAGCQSRDNEITVFSRTTLQPLFRLLGHAGSVLALLIIKEKGWLVSSSSAGDVRVSCIAKDKR